MTKESFAHVNGGAICAGKRNQEGDRVRERQRDDANAR